MFPIKVLSDRSTRKKHADVVLPSVPTKLFVRRWAIHDFVSIAGGMEGKAFLTMVGSPAGDDCFERSKSVSMMCPV